MIEKLRTSWRSYREKRRQYQIDRALYKAGGHRGPDQDGFGGGPESVEHARIQSGGGGPL